MAATRNFLFVAAGYNFNLLLRWLQFFCLDSWRLKKPPSPFNGSENRKVYGRPIDVRRFGVTMARSCQPLGLLEQQNAAADVAKM